MVEHRSATFIWSGSLWIAWVESYYIKNKSFWTLKIPNSCSWTWRKMLQLRGSFRNLIKLEIKDGANIFFWQDNWHDYGCFNEEWRNTIAQELIIPKDAKLCLFIKDIKDGCWKWQNRRSMHHELVSAMKTLPTIHMNYDRDKAVWIPNKGNYTTKSVWNSIRNHKDKVSWYKIVWYAGRIPSHVFFLWLNIKGRLSTQR